MYFLTVINYEVDYTEMLLSNFPKEDFPEEMVELAFLPDEDLKVDKSDIKIYFYSNKHSEGVEIDITNAKEFSKTDYSHSKKSIFLIHGWLNDYNYPMSQTVKNAYLHSHEVNVFIVDWSKIAHGEYSIVRNQVVQVGQIVADLISGMVNINVLSLSRTVLVGHSLGAHVAGNTGMALNREVDTIIGKFNEN